MSDWDGVAEAYRTSFALLCEGAVDRLLADTSGPLHLDVGSGTGVLAARAAGLGRTVVAVDAEPEMVALATEAVPGTALVARLPELPFCDGTFDAVTANFVVNHVPDPRAAVRELARVARPGGRVALTTWTAEPPGWAPLVSHAFEAAGVVAAPSSRLAPELDFERSVAGLSALAVGAGLAPARAEPLTWQTRVTADALWRGIAGGVGVAGRTYLAQPPPVRAAAERHFRAVAHEVAPDGLLDLRSAAAYVLAAA